MLSALAIAWEQYRGEQVQRYENAAVRMNNGLEIEPTEQEQLLQNARAVTHPLPQDLNPVATAVDVPVLVGQVEAEIIQMAMPSSGQVTPANALGEGEEKQKALAADLPWASLGDSNKHFFSICPRVVSADTLKGSLVAHGGNPLFWALTHQVNQPKVRRAPPLACPNYFGQGRQYVQPPNVLLVAQIL